MNDNASGYLLLCVVCVISMAIVGGLIALAVHLIKKSNEAAQQAEMAINQIMMRVPPDKQMMFTMQVNNVKKNSTTAILLALFLGGIGIHRFYLNETGMGIVYLLFCWTGIPAIAGFLEAFVIAGRVGKYNLQKAQEIAAILGV